jgi:hypothetical protein
MNKRLEREQSFGDGMTWEAEFDGIWKKPARRTKKAAAADSPASPGDP